MKTILAMQLNHANWTVGLPLPRIGTTETGEQKMVGRVDGTMVVRLDLVGDSLEVWATSEEDPLHGTHITLCKPSVSIITSKAEEGEWREAMAERDDRETVTEVLDLHNETWKLNGQVPTSGGRLTIESMTKLDAEEGDANEGVEVFAKSAPGIQPLAYMHFTLMPFFVQQITAKAPLLAWRELQSELDLVDDAEDPDDPDAQPELDGPVATRAAPPAASPAQVNGLAAPAHAAEPLADGATS